MENLEYSNSGILRRVIVDQIGAFLVLPNKLCITLSDVVSPIAIKIPEPAVRTFKICHFLKFVN